MKLAEHYLKGPQRIQQRVRSCPCGCKGADPQHKKELRRVVREIEASIQANARKRAVRELALALSHLDAMIEQYQELDTSEPSTCDLSELDHRAQLVLNAAHTVAKCARAGK